MTAEGPAGAARAGDAGRVSVTAKIAIMKKPIMYFVEILYMGNSFQDIMPPPRRFSVYFDESFPPSITA